MTIVIDASMIAAWLLPDEENEASDRILRTFNVMSGAAPSILFHEVRNVLLQSEKRKRISRETADELFVRFGEIVIDDYGNGEETKIVSLARTYGLSAYDAAYLALAIELNAPLATNDRRLAAGAQAAGVTLLGPYAAAPP